MENHGTIAWNDWEPVALSRAAAEGKLIFLDISATWCHWCHVLERTSLSDPRVVALLNESFIPVRVDTDRRPDINDRYNQGGWPTTAVLLPDGHLLTGATYLPPDALLELLSRCAEFYRKDREAVDRYLRETADRRESFPDASPPPGPRPGDLPLVSRAVLAAYDPEHPGFFLEPKFPVPDILAFARDSWVRGDARMGEVFLRVLRRMASSGLHDSGGGGFFRYATRRDWTVPHYEKLLSDNAEMLALYASAYALTGETDFARTGEGILRFLRGTLGDPATGAFYSSRDADEEYYALPATARAARQPPPLDRTVISEYNAMAVSALAAASAASGGGSPFGASAGDLLEAASRLSRFLGETLWTPGEGQIRFREGSRTGEGHLGDNVAAAAARLDLFAATGDREHRDAAGAAIDWTVRHFFAARIDGLLDRRPREGDFGVLARPLVPFGLNARAAAVLIRYARAADRTDLAAIAERLLAGLSAEFGSRGAFAAPYGSALLVRGEAPGGRPSTTRREPGAAG